MDNCVFCKIAKGEKEAVKVYEDDTVLAFLDQEPINPGHTLVIPKNHAEEFHQLGEESYDHLMRVVHMISRKVKDRLEPVRVGLWVHGFEVPHTHIHIVPLKHSDDIRRKFGKKPTLAELELVAKELS